jgi:hypothetical protein
MRHDKITGAGHLGTGTCNPWFIWPPQSMIDPGKDEEEENGN